MRLSLSSSADFRRPALASPSPLEQRPRSTRPSAPAAVAGSSSRQLSAARTPEPPGNKNICSDRRAEAPARAVAVCSAAAAAAAAGGAADLPKRKKKRRKSTRRKKPMTTSRYPMPPPAPIEHAFAPSAPSDASGAMQVVFVATEVAPWSKVGGLGDVMAALPAALASR